MVASAPSFPVEKNQQAHGGGTPRKWVALGIYGRRDWAFTPQAFGLMAGYGLQLWPILQDLHQFWSVYGERAGTFLSNAGMVQVFNVADIETANWVSRSIGATTVAYETSGASASRAPTQFFSTHGTSTATHLARRDLITPDEIMRLDRSLEILLQPGLPPMWAWKVRYYADPEFAQLFRR